jgi:hypothetical protein
MTLYSRNVQTYYSLVHDIKRNQCRQGERSQEEQEMRANLYAACCTRRTLKSHMVGSRTSSLGSVLGTSQKGQRVT